MKNAVRDFKEFVLKGDVVALAVAVIIATAFGAVIAAFVANVVTPLIAAIGGQPDFGQLDFTINGSRFQYGLFINAVITFLIIAAVVFFLVVRPYNAFKKRFAARGRRGRPAARVRRRDRAGRRPAGAAQRPRRATAGGSCRWARAATARSPRCSSRARSEPRRASRG